MTIIPFSSGVFSSSFFVFLKYNNYIAGSILFNNNNKQPERQATSAAKDEDAFDGDEKRANGEMIAFRRCDVVSRIKHFASTYLAMAKPS